MTLREGSRSPKNSQTFLLQFAILYDRNIVLPHRKGVGFVRDSGSRCTYGIRVKVASRDKQSGMPLASFAADNGLRGLPRRRLFFFVAFWEWEGQNDVNHEEIRGSN